MKATPAFWNRFAERYAARPIKDLAAYEAMLADVAARLKPDDCVLEIGCGTGGTAIRLASGVARYVATDFSAEMIRIAVSKPAPPTLHFHLAEATELTEAGPFNAICAFNVLHLVDDLPRLLHHLRGSLAPGGLFICKTWCFGDLPLRVRLLLRVLRAVALFPPARFLTRDQFYQAVRAAGFAIDAMQTYGDRAANPFIVARAAEPSSAGV